MRKTLAALALALPLAWAGPVQANTVYSYVGDLFTSVIDLPFPAGSYDTSMRVSGSFELTSALPANLAFTDIGASILNFSFSDGRSTIASGDADLSNFFNVQTDAAGQIVAWSLILQRTPFVTLANDPQVSIFTQNDPNGLGFGTPVVEDRGDFVQCDPAGVPRGLCISQLDSASVTNAPGTWTVAPGPPVGVAAPSSAALMGLALMALALTARWRVPPS
jgi:hypothetical protein